VDLPDYERRLVTYANRWSEAIEFVTQSNKRFGVVVGDISVTNVGGFELAYPYEVIRDFARQIIDDGGTFELVCLIDDSFAQHSWRSSDVHSRVLNRHLAITETRRLSAALKAATDSSVHSHLLTFQGPAINMWSAILRQNRLTVYLCYPINAFRRRPDHPARAEIDSLRVRLLSMDIRVFDPLALDEDSVIIGLEHVDDRMVVAKASNRWRTSTANRLLDTEQRLDLDDSSISVPFGGPREAARPAKAQVPQRDFYWIDRSDVVVSWRPFLDGMHHAGVLSELQYALHTQKPILAFNPDSDIGEHPSPFASMISTVPDQTSFDRALEMLHNESKNQRTRRMSTESLPKYCDHTSVGILIFDSEGKVLLIDRGTFPFGKAPPAGHVDDHGSYEEAARAEAFEEVGVRLGDGLELVSEGRRENPCRRVNGTWHYWKVFKTVLDHNQPLTLSEREVKSASWYTLAELADLGVLEPADDGPVESVWRKFLAELLSGEEK
jgi:ADP-ribose pyrophosphatase YjhB (NUDIX family)